MSDVSVSSKRVPLGDVPAASRRNPVFPASGRRADLPPQYTASADIDVEVVSDLASIAVLWEIFEKLADTTPFQTFAWLDHWQRHIGRRKGTLPVIVIGRTGDGDILFMLPLAIEKG